MNKIFKIFLFLNICLITNIFSVVDMCDCHEFIKYAKIGDIEKMRVLLDRYSDEKDKKTIVNSKDCKGGTALSWSAYKGYDKIVELLLSNNAIVDLPNKFGTTALSRSKNKRIAQLLIDAGANVNLEEPDGHTPLIWAVENEKKELVDFFLNIGANVDVSIKRGPHVLDIAANKIDDFFLNSLLSIPCSTIIVNNFGARPLSWFAKRGDLRAVEICLKKGFIINHHDDDLSTALIWAASYGHDDVVEYLLEKGADKNLSDKNSCTALHWAASKGHYITTKYLLKHGADIDIRDNDGKTPLMNAVVSGNYDLIRYFIEWILKKGKYEQFSIASNYKRERSILHWLFRKHPNAPVKKNEHPYSKESFFSTFKMIVKKCWTHLDFNQKDSYGCSIIHSIIKSGDYKCLDFLLRFMYKKYDSFSFIKEELFEKVDKRNRNAFIIIKDLLEDRFREISSDYKYDLRHTKKVIEEWLSFYERLSILQECEENYFSSDDLDFSRTRKRRKIS